MSNSLVYALNQTVTTTGSLGIGVIRDEGKVRFVITDAGPANIVRVRARITGQAGWATLANLTGNVNEAVDVFTYDEIEVIVLVYDSLSNHVIVIAESFDGSVISVNTPDGGIDNFNTITFTSNDASVAITSNPATGTIDFAVVGGGVGSANYASSFNATTDWSGPTSGLYSKTVAFATHAKANPIVETFETNGAVFDLVNTEVSVDASYNVSILVTEIPDLRFAGKLIIS